MDPVLDSICAEKGVFLRFEAEALGYPDHAIAKAVAQRRWIRVRRGAYTLAHRYAVSMDVVDTVVLGCKNRKEVLECVAAVEAGPLEPGIMARIDATFAV